ncbi:MAG: zinc-binding dehydrogenase [bacterium]|nr:zinc-binding dehydrogenase [bacterium]
MKAVHITEHGDPSVLQLVDLPDPEPSAGEVLVRVLGVSVNHLDLWVRRGMPGVTLPLPMILGCDGTGEVVATGTGVTSVRTGQRVVLEPGFTQGDSAEVRAGNDHLAADYGIRGEHGDGFDAELVVLPERYVLPLPDGIDPVHAAAVPLVFLTAWSMLMTRAHLSAGETVLVLGAGSGVGTAAIQVAKDAGARILTTASGEESRALGIELGADVAIDHSDPDWPKAVKQATDGRGVDVVVEHVGPATWKGSMRVLARNGRLVTCGATTGPKVEVLLPHLFMKNISVLGSTMGPRNALPEIFARVARGAFRPVVDRVMPMSEVRGAHTLLEERAVRGKIIMVPGE